MSLEWKLYNGDGKTPAPGQSVKPGERLTWPRTIGIGAQHVVAMFGATFVFPLIMGLDANLAVMMSAVATIIYLLIVNGKVPSDLGTSAAFVGGVAAIHAAGGGPAAVTGAIIIAGLVLLLVGVIVHFAGGHVIQKFLAPAVTGAVVMLIGFNLAPVVAGTYWPQDQWDGFATMAFVTIASLLLRGIWSRVSILLALVFGYILSWILDKTAGQITSVMLGQNLLDVNGKACAADGLYCHASAVPHFRTNFGAVADANWLDIGGAVPGSMPSHATSVFEEGLMVPPMRRWDADVPNETALKIMTRNSRMPDSLAADIDAECSACLMDARRLSELFNRYGVETVERCVDAILDRTTKTYQREILSKIPDGEYAWEDYAEHDGVDEPRLHTQRITLAKTSTDGPGGGPKIIHAFTGTAPQAKRPINQCGDYADGNFLAKWLAPILRNLADTPERMAELDVNEGVIPLIEMRFPEKGALLTPIFPAPTNARTFVILRLLGVLAGVVAKAVYGKMPADQETIRYTGVDGKMPADQETIRYTGVDGTDADGQPYLMREVLGGGSGGRYYADGEDTIHVVPDSRNLSSEFTESRFPFVAEKLGLAVDSGGAGKYRSGLGYEKHIRMLREAHFMSIADRSILACWGVTGGKAGTWFQVTIDRGGPNGRQVDALADGEPVAVGQVIRIRTTGGGGWSDPLERDPEIVLRDVHWGKVSVQGGADSYAVVITGDGTEATLDMAQTEHLRESCRGEAHTDADPFRGPGTRASPVVRIFADVDAR